MIKEIDDRIERLKTIRTEHIEGVIRFDSKSIVANADSIDATSRSIDGLISELEWVKSLIEKNNTNIAYKWRKIFAAINHNKGRIELTPVEAQELIDDIERL